MANETLITVGATEFCFRDSTDFSPTTNNDYRIGTPTYAQMDMGSLNNAAGRQSAKVDLGATRPEYFAVYGAFELLATPTSGERIDLYWAPSNSSTTARANPHGMSGADAALAGGYGDVAELLKNLHYIGSLITTDDVTIQHGYIGTFSSPSRYGQLVVMNESDAQFQTTDSAEHHVVFNGIVPQYQTA